MATTHRILRLRCCFTFTYFGSLYDRARQSDLFAKYLRDFLYHADCWLCICKPIRQRDPAGSSNRWHNVALVG